jgi:tetratricopeptide (TPR) repeat protein
MRRLAWLSTLFAILLSASAALAAGGRADALSDLADAKASTRRAAVDRVAETGTMADAPALVKALRDDDEDVRRAAEAALWRVWSRSGDADVDALFASGLREMESGDVEAAIKTFSRVIEKKPSFAEGWNKRATLYFLSGDLRRSLADCDEVIKRNPQHFGVLAGYAQIYAQLQYYERALEYSRRALAINPNLDGVRRNIEVLEEAVRQRRRQAI